LERAVTVVVCGVLAQAAQAAGPVASIAVDWPAFLGRNDLVWTKAPDRWETGAFMGNGLLGANVYATEDGKNLLWRMGRTDVVALDSRIPIGDLVLKTAGALKSASLRLDLWNAELSGTITTDKGVIEVRS